MAGTLRCERDGALATVVLSNPGKLNAVDFAMWERLAGIMTELSADDHRGGYFFLL